MQMTGFKSVPEIVNEPSNSVKESKNPAKNLQGMFVSIKTYASVVLCYVEK